MKIVALLLMIAVSANSFAENDETLKPNPLLSFIAEITGLKQYALYSVITNRCDRYLPTRTEQKLCHRAVDKKIDLLDFDLFSVGNKQQNDPAELIQPHPYIIVAFKKNLLSLLNESRTQVYLNSVQLELTRFLTEDRFYPANLWELTLKYYPSQEMAAKVIATLFQDTSPVKMHLLYLEKTKTQGNENFEDNKELLSRVIDTIQMITDYSGESFQKVFYPRDVATQLNKAIYHFYVPLHLSLALKRSGIDGRYAYIAPLMMTLSYEFISTSNDYSYIYKDPARLDPGLSQDMYKIRDIYAGYLGARYGAKLQPKSLNDIAGAFDAKTADGVNLLLK